MTSTRAEDEVVELCSELIRFDTSNTGELDTTKGEREAADYVAAKLADVGIDYERVESGAPGRDNVFCRIPGADPGRDALLVHGHLDVVPADASEWSVHPFSGAVQDGYVWGRGAVDMKDMCATILTVLSRWSAAGTVPRRDLVLAFVADEEDRGEWGARWLVDEHPSLFEGCAAAIGESGGYTVHAVGAGGEPVRLYPVATAERGTSHLRLTATGRAGHASRRNEDNAVTTLVHALSRLASHRWPVHLTPAVSAFLATAGPALGISVDLGDMDETLRRLGPAAKVIENTVRNSATPTVLEAGYKVNVIPGSASALVDTRVLPGTEEELLAEIDRLVGPAVRREFVHRQAAVQAPVDSPWFDAMAASLRAFDESAVVVPFCMGGGTDAKAFARLGIDGYGFAPLYVPAGDNHHLMAHGVDERVAVEGLRFGVNVLDRFLSTV
jgi:acetylornithine deacetylase/succinyl-diaminopimelate desuccinylase-like protein